MSELHDFGDGKGPVPAKRHANGGGWVADTAIVSVSAFVGPDAMVYGNAVVYGYAMVYGNAEVFGYARVYGNAVVYGYASVYGNAEVFGYARVYGNTVVYGNAVVSRNPKVLTGFPHVVTVSDHHVTVGCQMHPPSVWKERGTAIIRSEGYSTAEAKSWASIINAIAEAHGCKDKEN